MSSSTLDSIIRTGLAEDAERCADRLVSSGDMLKFAEARYIYRLNQAIYDSIRIVSKTVGPHDDVIWEAAAKWTQEGNFEYFLEKLEADKVVSYLNCFGYPASSLVGAVGRKCVGWRDTDRSSWPRISFSIGGFQDSGSHEEHAGCTWYMVDCVLGPLPLASQRNNGPYVLSVEDEASLQTTGENRQQLAWRSPRRLVHLREALHDFIKEMLKDEYTDHFGETPFAKHGAPKGTTARLRAWLDKLADLINFRGVSPEIVMRTLVFLRPPTFLREVRDSRDATVLTNGDVSANVPCATPVAPFPEAEFDPFSFGAVQNNVVRSVEAGKDDVDMEDAATHGPAPLTAPAALQPASNRATQHQDI